MNSKGLEELRNINDDIIELIAVRTGYVKQAANFKKGWQN